jgi:uncharacterized membrane protein
MNRIRSVGSTLGKAIVLCAWALTLVGDISAAPNSQDSSGAEQQIRQQNELTFAQIDFPRALGTVVFGFNDRGQIVGTAPDAGGILHGFLLDSGVFTQIDPPGVVAAYGINNRGQIVGQFFDGGSTHGFLLDDDAFTQIDFPGATATQAGRINNRGRIVGHFLDAGQGVHRYLLANGVFTEIVVPGEVTRILATSAPQIGINDRGQIVSEFMDTAGAGHSFLLDDGVFTQIDVPGGTGTSASAINNRGQIVVSFSDAGGVVAAHGFFLDQGVFTQIDVPGASPTLVTGINNRGQIVGSFLDADGIAHGFLATKEQFSGKAIGVGAGQENTAVEIVGTLTSPTDLDLSTATLTITNLLNERTGSGEIIGGLPLVLTAAPGSRRNFARFVDRSRPNVTSVTIHDAGSGVFSFEIKVSDAIINSPQNCSPTRLTTGFRLDAANNPPIVVSTERPWDCLGPSNRSLKTH